MIKMKRNLFVFVFSILLLGIITPLFSPSSMVKAQTGYIDVYVYDAFTYDPIIGADVVLFDDLYNYLEDGPTDDTGFYQFTALEIGDYWVEVYADGYPWNTSFVTIDYEGEGEFVEFLLEPTFTPGNGFIDVYVYDSVTLDPIVGADVYLWSENWDYITSGWTDIDGFYNFTGLGAATYIVEAYAMNYEWDYAYVTIDFDGEGELVEFYLDLVFIPGNGFIDVYVYDLVTLDPIVGAYVELYSENWYYITSGMTDIDGFYNFTGLGAATYIVEAYAMNYEWDYAYVTIDFDGEGEYLELYLAPGFIPGNGFIDVYVYDAITYAPIVGADVELYTEYGTYVNWGWTDIDGFYNFTDLGAATYIVEAYAMNYEWDYAYVTIDFDGEGEYLELYLQPMVHAIDILSPGDFETIEGGVVLVSCDANDIYNLDYIEVYVNAMLIITFDVYNQGFNSEFFVPVFGNGTNTIVLEAYWLDMSTDSDSVDVNSINVIPIVEVKVGDIMNYNAVDYSSTQEADYNFTFTEWLSPFEINITAILHMYDHTGTIMYTECFIHVNVLNGYVSYDPSGVFVDMRFFPFSNLLPNPQVGDQIPMFYWSSMLTVTGSVLWEYTDVWTLEDLSATMDVYIEKSANILYYYGYPDDVFNVTLIETTIDFLNPYLSDEVDFDYNEGDTGNIISWYATDMNPGTYIIYKDGIEEDTGFWNSATPIEINVDGLTEGTYTFVITVMDLAGNTAQDTVTVTVTPVIPEFGLIHSLLFLPILILATHLFVSKRKKNNK